MNIHKISPRCKIAFALLLLFGVFFRFYNLGKKAFWQDEAATALLISGYSHPEMERELASSHLTTVAQLARFQHLHPSRGAIYTARALTIDDPQHTPLYYVSLRIWANIFGDSIVALRAFSALLSLLMLPALWLLCRELFYDQIHRAWIEATVIIMIWLSPFHVLYAQEAREYSLLAVLAVFSTACLLRAWRKGAAWWALYALSAAIAIYTQSLFVLMWLAHAVMVVGLYAMALNAPLEATLGESPRKLQTKLLAFGAATLVAALMFLPWAFLIWKGQTTISDHAAWFSAPVAVRYLLKTWIFNFVNVFFDVNHNQLQASFWSVHPLAATLVRAVRFLLILLCAAACYSVWRFAPRRIALVLAMWFLVTFFTLAIPDLLLGGKRSAVPRFSEACFLALQITVAYFLATKIFNSWQNSAHHSARAKRPFWAGVLAMLIAGMLISNVVSAQSQTWWTKFDAFNLPRVAKIMQAQKNSILVAPLNDNLLAMSRLLAPQHHLVLMSGDGLNYLDRRRVDVRQLERLAPTHPIFFYDITLQQKNALAEQGVTLVEVTSALSLWRLQENEKISHAQE